jgi:hypothetical protein
MTIKGMSKKGKGKGEGKIKGLRYIIYILLRYITYIYIMCIYIYTHNVLFKYIYIFIQNNETYLTLFKKGKEGGGLKEYNRGGKFVQCI